MPTLYRLTQFRIPSGGVTIPLGPGLTFWLAIANDPIAGQATGTNVTVTLTGKRGRETLQANYAAPALKRQYNARLVTITGTGAFIELWLATEEVTVTPQIVTITATSVNVNVANQVDVNLKQVAEVNVPTISGGIPIEDGPGGGELAGVNASKRLTAAAAVTNTPSVNAQIVGPLYKPGVVDVHDTGP